MPRATELRHLAADGVKMCAKCMAVKPVEDFYKRKEAPDSYRNDCKECVKSRSRDYYAENQEDRVAYSRNWYHQNRERAKARREVWYERVGRERKSVRRRGMSDEDRRLYNEGQRAARAADPKRYRRYDLAGRLRRYGLTLEDYENLVDLQGGCGICGGPPNGKGPDVYHIDHCHITGAFRGLLCSTCNIGIGALGDDVERLIAAIGYLLGPPAVRLPQAI